MKIREGLPDDLERLINFMKQVDHEFVPPLSLRPGGIYKRVSGTLANEDSNFLICESNGRVVGVVGYRKNWNGIEKVLLEAYISFIAVHPRHRGQNISGLLDLALAQNLDSDGTTHINVKTWSTNPVAYRMYQRLGYVESNTLEDHRGPGVDTIYFRKSLK
jgi:ribosomal protein S18 acetylase RimI-like enzyme